MANAPDKQVSCTELLRLFNESGWNERLKSCKKTDYYDQPTPTEKGFAFGTRTVGYEYKDSSGKFIALVFYRVKPDGTVTHTSPKELLIDGVMYYC
jgi:hypothetical protein